MNNLKNVINVVQMSQALCTAYRLPVYRVRNIQAMWLTHYVVTCKPWFYSENADFFIYISIYIIYIDIYMFQLLLSADS